MDFWLEHMLRLLRSKSATVMGSAEEGFYIMGNAIAFLHTFKNNIAYKNIISDI